MKTDIVKKTPSSVAVLTGDEVMDDMLAQTMKALETDRKEAELLGVDYIVSAEQLCVEAVREFASRRGNAPNTSNGSPSSLIEGVITLNP